MHGRNTASKWRGCLSSKGCMRRNVFIWNNSSITQEDAIQYPLVSSYSLPQVLCSKTSKAPHHNSGSQDCSPLCNCLFLFLQTVYRFAECTYHPIVHYMMVVECAREDVSISNWKENGSELASQRLEVLEFRHKLRDDIFKSIFTYMALLCISNFCIYPSIPTSQYISLQSYQLLERLPPCTFAAISNVHLYKNVKKNSRSCRYVWPLPSRTSIASLAVTSPTRHAVQWNLGGQNPGGVLFFSPNTSVV